MVFPAKPRAMKTLSGKRQYERNCIDLKGASVPGLGFRCHKFCSVNQSPVFSYAAQAWLHLRCNHRHCNQHSSKHRLTTRCLPSSLERLCSPHTGTISLWIGALQISIKDDLEHIAAVLRLSSALTEASSNLGEHCMQAHGSREDNLSQPPYCFIVCNCSVPRNNIPKLVLGHKGIPGLSLLGDLHSGKSQEGITTVAWQ